MPDTITPGSNGAPATSQAGTWMLYGAAGYTGTLIAQHACERGHRPALAGRTAPAALAAMPVPHPLEVEQPPGCRVLAVATPAGPPFPGHLVRTLQADRPGWRPA
jgi:hypothetical protein